MSKPSDINTKLIDIITERKNGDKIINEKINLEKELHKKKNNTVLFEISEETENRNNKDLELKKKIDSLPKKENNQRKKLLERINFLENKILNLQGISPKIEKPPVIEKQNEKTNIKSCEDSLSYNRNGFVIKKNNNWKLVETNLDIKSIAITRSLPPTKIMLKYGNNCEIMYNLIRDNKNLNCCYYYNGYYYLPEDKYLLRYSTTGILTEDYRICRITIINKDNKINLTIENKKLFDINKLENQFKLWKSNNIDNYNFDFRWSCYCTPEFIEPVNITINNNKIISAVYIKTKQRVKDTSYLKTFDQLFDYIKDAYKRKAWDIKVKYDQNYNFVRYNYIDYIEKAIDDERGFEVSNFNILNNIQFVIKNKDRINFVKTNIKFEIITITKDLPPSIILLKYNSCQVRYQINNNSKVGLYYNDNIYTPQDKYLLRYSPSGIVTLDYRPCRITIIGENNYKLSIEK